jgi:hypothetical protein
MPQQQKAPHPRYRVAQPMRVQRAHIIPVQEYGTPRDIIKPQQQPRNGRLAAPTDTTPGRKQYVVFSPRTRTHLPPTIAVMVPGARSREKSSRILLRQCQQGSARIVGAVRGLWPGGVRKRDIAQLDSAFHRRSHGNMTAWRRQQLSMGCDQSGVLAPVTGMAGSLSSSSHNRLLAPVPWRGNNVQTCSSSSARHHHHHHHHQPITYTKTPSHSIKHKHTHTHTHTLHRPITPSRTFMRSEKKVARFVSEIPTYALVHNETRSTTPATHTHSAPIHQERRKRPC